MVSSEYNKTADFLSHGVWSFAKSIQRRIYLIVMKRTTVQRMAYWRTQFQIHPSIRQTWFPLTSKPNTSCTETPFVTRLWYAYAAKNESEKASVISNPKIKNRHQRGYTKLFFAQTDRRLWCGITLKLLEYVPWSRHDLQQASESTLGKGVPWTMQRTVSWSRPETP